MEVEGREGRAAGGVAGECGETRKAGAVEGRGWRLGAGEGVLRRGEEEEGAWKSAHKK